MKEKLANLKKEFLENIEKINNLEELKEFENSFLGKK
jgi:hypothetical protein